MRNSVIFINKITFLIIGSGLVTAILILRLFQLQVLAHDYYQAAATKGQFGQIELPAQRGEIIIKDHHSDEEFLLATNTTLNLLFADPTIIDNPVYLADILAPILFDVEDERAADNERIEKIRNGGIPQEMTEEEIEELLKPLTDDELRKNFKTNLLDKISQKQRQEIILTKEATPENLNRLKTLAPTGIEVIDNWVYAYPPKISDPSYIAKQIADYVEIPSSKLAKILEGENRYVVIQKKLQPDISDQIKQYMKDEKEAFRGLGMQEEYFRFYPEGSIGANIVGYVSRDNMGQYGIESTYNTQLKGVAGKFQTKLDSIGRQITVGESVLEPAIDGNDIVLTIDRSIQLKTEKILEQTVKQYNADSGQIIIMNPKTGSIIAMAHYPSFDPNVYGDAFTKVKAELTPEQINELVPSKDEGIYYHYTNKVTLDRHLIFEEIDENGNKTYLRYKNYVGPEVYHNKIVAWPYEPGSVFKTITMAIGIDDGDITPNTTYNDEGPIGVDWNVYSEDYDFEIKNAEGYYGLVDMTTVLAKSLNTGMTFIAKKIGPALFYSYMEKFGFLSRTDIEFDSETTGQIEYFEDWTESELATHAFGQGISVTMLQMANAYSAIVNGGILMQPHIVEEIRHDDGTTTETDPQEIRQVISEDTSAKMVAMLVNSTEKGVAKKAQVEGHLVGGKTGTSQTYKHGRALSGSGTTITSFAGFGPVDDPQFVILIKFDRPKASEWGATTAAPTFSQVAEYLFNYYNIPPDK